jgi:4-hydroxy-3-polyprenylbenzoate decarboxylase
MTKKITLAMTGASGSAYGLKLLEKLLAAQCEVYLIVSNAARIVLNTECDFPLLDNAADLKRELATRYTNTDKLQVLEVKDWMSAPASGSAKIDAMVVCPCSMGSLSAIATGASNSLLERAADVMIKENRKLILLVREMPFSAIHLENMLKLARLGVSIMPASPGFYNKPDTINDLVNFVVSRLLSQLGINDNSALEWGKDNLKKGELK